MGETTRAGAAAGRTTRYLFALAFGLLLALAALSHSAYADIAPEAQPQEQPIEEMLPAEEAEAVPETLPVEEAAPDAVPESPAEDEPAAAELELEPAAVEPALEPAATVPIYRLYNWRTSEHLYTSSRTEYDSLPDRTKGDWVQEGIAWYAPDKSRTPVYRLYNPRSGDHHYTTNAAERDVLVRSHGWRSEGTAFYSDDYKRVAIHRVYNRRLTRGQHHYTTSASERDSLVRSHGWRNEGTGFYGVRVGKTESFRMVPAGTYIGYAGHSTWWTLTIRSDGTCSLEIYSPNSTPDTFSFSGTVAMKTKYVCIYNNYPELRSTGGPYSFTITPSTVTPTGYPWGFPKRNFRYNPSPEGDDIWVAWPDGDDAVEEFLLCRSY